MAADPARGCNKDFTALYRCGKFAVRINLEIGRRANKRVYRERRWIKDGFIGVAVNLSAGRWTATCVSVFQERDQRLVFGE